MSGGELLFQAYRHLDREFRAVSTCGRGHVGVHHIGYAFPDQRDRRRRVQRRCSVDECGSCWSELALTAEPVSAQESVSSERAS